MGFREFLVIAVIVMILFAPKMIPGLARAIGESIKGFKSGISGDEDKKE